MAAIDVGFARSCFPALATADELLLDNAGGSQTLRGVAARISDYLLTTNVQLGASYATSLRADKRVKEGTHAGALLMNADVWEVVYASSASVAFGNISQALGPTLRSDDEIIVTNFDHEANVGAWERMAKLHGCVLKTWQIDRDTLRPSLDALKALLSPKTRLVCCTHVSNILGSIHDIQAIAELVHSVPGAEICVDAVAYAPHRAVDVRELGVDYYVFSWYKVYGPHCAIIYARARALARLTSINHHFLPSNEHHQLASKLQPGSVNHEFNYSLTAIRDYFVALGHDDPKSLDLDHLPTLERDQARAAIVGAFDKIAAHEEALSKVILDYLALKKDKGVRIIGEPTADRKLRVPTVAFVVEGRKSSEIVALVDEKHIGIRWGHFYSKRLIDYLGLDKYDGIVRVSMVHYNTPEEVQQVVRVLDDIIENRFQG